jgi:predicted RNA-binding Zn-ribbon protein involved in translation (DUF1610 family)
VKIKQHYSECDKCQTSVKFEDTDEVKSCPNCGRQIALSDAVKKYLEDEQERLKGIE